MEMTAAVSALCPKLIGNQTAMTKSKMPCTCRSNKIQFSFPIPAHLGSPEHGNTQWYMCTYTQSLGKKPERQVSEFNISDLYQATRWNHLSVFNRIKQKKTLFEQRAHNVRLLSSVHAHVSCHTVQQNADRYSERIGRCVINQVWTKRRKIVQFNEIVVVTYISLLTIYDTLTTATQLQNHLHSTNETEFCSCDYSKCF